MRGNTLPVVLTVILAFASAAAGAPPKWRYAGVPGSWESLGGKMRSYDGFGWYRCFVKVPKSWAGRGLSLELGDIDDSDEAFVNGERVGGTGGMPPKYRGAFGTIRRYRVEAKLVLPGRWNLIAVRVYDGGGGGGIVREPLALSCDKGKMSLKGDWQFRAGDDPAWGRWPVDPRGADAEKLAAEYVKSAPQPVGAKAMSFTGEAAPPEGEWALWYRLPAKKWDEALPVGNGRLGA